MAVSVLKVGCGSSVLHYTKQLYGAVHAVPEIGHAMLAAKLLTTATDSNGPWPAKKGEGDHQIKRRVVASDQPLMIVINDCVNHG